MTGSETKGQRDREATKDRLVDAVGMLLARDGFGALGINAVAAEAGVDKVLIYRYFDGMPGLLHAFGESADFWPSVEEVLGDEPWDTLPIGERWAGGLSRYAAALRRRPITKEILAWEQVEQSELCEILRDARVRWFEELMTHFPDDPDATDVDLVATILLIVGAIHYFVVVGRLQADFSGMEVGSEAGWEQIDELIRTICVRTLRPVVVPGN
ncbi:MAG: TetR/AcrR family transcriptional regulator [Acidimicrobiia bacterium]